MPSSVTGDSQTNGPSEVQFHSKTPKYLQRPPTIAPNYGRKKHSLLPKSNISRVLLYDNVMQQQMLDVKLNNIKLEKQRAGKILDLHRKSFMLRQSHKQHMLPQTVAPPTLPKIPTRHYSDDSSGYLKKWTGKRSRSFPTESTGPRNDDSETPVQVPLRLEQNIGTETEDALSESNGLNLPRIEGRESRGITKTLLIQTNTVEYQEHDMVDNLRDAKSDDLYHDTNEATQAEKSTVVHNGHHSAVLASRKEKSTVVDPRFLSLQRTLQQIDHHTEGFAELSPSFSRKYIKIPDYLTSM